MGVGAERVPGEHVESDVYRELDGQSGFQENCGTMSRVGGTGDWTCIPCLMSRVGCTGDSTGRVDQLGNAWRRGVALHVAKRPAQ